VASGINNAVSRVAGLLAIAVLGLVFATAFDRRLERGLDGLGLPAVERRGVEAQRGKLAAARSDDVRAQRLIRESFVGAYGVVLRIAVGLSVASALSAAVLIEARPKAQRFG
jgi:hypothetical protein